MSSSTKAASARAASAAAASPDEAHSWALPRRAVACSTHRRSVLNTVSTEAAALLVTRLLGRLLWQ